MQREGLHGEMRLEGIAVSEGVAMGRACVWRRETPLLRQTAGPVESGDAEAEVLRLEKAREAVRKELQEEAARLGAWLGQAHAEILGVQEEFLDDPAFWPQVVRKVREEGLPAEAAVQRVSEQVAAMLAGLDDAYLRERAIDIQDVVGRLVRRLQGGASPGALWDEEDPGPSVVVVDELFPSEAARLDPARVYGVITERGGKTSHAAFLLKALGIPAVFGVEGARSAVFDGETVAVDGDAGIVIVRPSEATVAGVARRQSETRRLEGEWATLREAASCSADGRRVVLEANISTPAEVEMALANGAEGVGLFRTELFFLETPTLPDEEMQYAAYRRVVEGMRGRPVTIRTLDVGGDKEIPGIPLLKEPNPFLGHRGIRLSLEQSELLDAQLRAILRASAHGPVRVMFPMVSGLEELRAAKAALQAVREALAARGVAMADRVPVGIMVEVPSAAILADRFAEEVDFFSIGTNDLVQYALAADRTNEKVADLYDPFHPAVLRLIAQVVEAAHRKGIPAAMCGDMAGDPLATPILLGLGLDEWSMNSGALKRVKPLLVCLEYAATRELVERVLRLGTAAEVRAETMAFLQKLRRRPSRETW